MPDIPAVFILQQCNFGFQLTISKMIKEFVILIALCSENTVVDTVMA